MNIKFNYDEEKPTIYLSGELDHHNAELIRGKMEEFISRVNVGEIIFDFSSMTFMDSTGIGVLLGRYKRLKERAITVYARGAKGSIDKLLKLSGIYNIFIKI